MTDENPQLIQAVFPNSPEFQEVHRELRRLGAGIGLAGIAENDLPAPGFEGNAFEAPNGFRYDSQAAWFITRWLHAAGLGPPEPRRMEQMLAGLEEHPQREVTLASPGFLTEATVFTLTDGSMIMVDWPGENPGAFCLHRFTGGIPQDQQCWLDWGYNPPVASARRPLPGNERPQTESLEIR